MRLLAEHFSRFRVFRYEEAIDHLRTSFSEIPQTPPTPSSSFREETKLIPIQNKRLNTLILTLQTEDARRQDSELNNS
jgi:hypothetical protein